MSEDVRTTGEPQRSLRLGLDIDGVLADWCEGFRNVLATVTGKTLVPVTETVPPVWNWMKHYGYTPEDVSKASAAAEADPFFWERLNPRPGAIKFLDQLWRWQSFENWSKGQSIEVYFLTNREGVRVKDQTERWLREYGYGGRVPTVCICRGEKGLMTRALGLNVIIDDKPENLVSAQLTTPDIAPLLWHAPYNENVSFFQKPVTRVYDFDQLARMLGVIE